MARDAGFVDTCFGKEVMRAVAVLFPQDDALLAIPMYRRHNRSRQVRQSVACACVCHAMHILRNCARRHANMCMP